MKKILVIAAIVLPFITSGCKPTPVEKPKTLYTKSINEVLAKYGRDAEKNELYIFQNNAIKALNGKYSSQEVVEEDDAKALQDFNTVIADLDQTLKDYQTLAASGKDFGDTNFEITYKYQVSKEGNLLKESAPYVFAYSSNIRLISETSIKIDTRYAGEVSADEPIQIADSKIAVVVDKFKLYNEDGTPSDAGFVTKVEPTTVEGFTAFDVFYHAKKGANPGKFYLLVTFHDQDDPSFIADFRIDIEHITE